MISQITYLRKLQVIYKIKKNMQGQYVQQFSVIFTNCLLIVMCIGYRILYQIRCFTKFTLYCIIFTLLYMVRVLCDNKYVVVGYIATLHIRRIIMMYDKETVGVSLPIGYKNPPLQYTACMIWQSIQFDKEFTLPCIIIRFHDLL